MECKMMDTRFTIGKILLQSNYNYLGKNEHSTPTLNKLINRRNRESIDANNINRFRNHANEIYKSWKWYPNIWMYLIWKNKINTKSKFLIS